MPRKALIDILQTVVIVGLIIFVIIQYKPSKPTSAFQLESSQSPSPDNNPSDTDTTTKDFTFLEDANTSLQASVSGLLNRLESLENTNSKTTTPVKTTTSYTPRSTTPSFQTQDIFFGSATTTSTSWVDTGQETSLYSAHYPTTVNCYFEAGLSIIGGEVWARLKNKTTGAVIPITEVSHNNNTTTWKNSSAFKLHSGNNTYVVQLKSTSGETANLTGARIKITQ